MTSQALEEIVAVEKEIRTRLAEERGKAETWLAGEREAIERETEAELADLRRTFRERVTLAENAADVTGNETVTRAEAYAARLRALPDEKLREILARHLAEANREGRP